MAGTNLIGKRVYIKDNVWGYSNTVGKIVGWDGRHYEVDVGNNTTMLSRDDFVIKRLGVAKKPKKHPCVKPRNVGNRR